MHTHPYRPDKFSHTYETLQGAQLWNWLHFPEQLLVMEVACTLRRPAVEALSPYLRVAFPKHIQHRAFRQMTGHMVRQILQARGFALNRNNVRILQPQNAFGFGSTYHRMQAA